jgi:hypothetical protein
MDNIKVPSRSAYEGRRVTPEESPEKMIFDGEMGW